MKHLLGEKVPGTEGLKSSREAEWEPKATGRSETFNMEIRFRLLGGRVMTDWKKLPVEVVYFPSPHTSKTGTAALGELGASYTSCLARGGGKELK